MKRAFFVCVVVLVASGPFACGSDDEQSVAPTSSAPDSSSSSNADAATSSDSASTNDAPLDANGSVADAAVDAKPATVYTGEATYYDAHGANACGLSLSGSNYLVAAMNKSQYSKSLCGKCAHVIGPKGEVTVKIVDLCPGCSMGDLDLSEEAFAQISPLSAGRVKISWSYTTCP